VLWFEPDRRRSLAINIRLRSMCRKLPHDWAPISAANYRNGPETVIGTVDNSPSMPHPSAAARVTVRWGRPTVSAIGDLVHRDTHAAESHRSRRHGSSTGCLVPLPAAVSGRPAFRAPWPPCRRKSERSTVEAAKPRDFAIVRLSQRRNWQGDRARPDLRPMLPSSGGGATPHWQAGVQP
jgi:hypothetical protein